MSTILAAVDLTRPWHAISPTVVGDTLVELSRAEEPLSGRALARRAGRAHAGVARVLDDLAEAGLVRVTPAGATSLHELNEHHVLAEAVRTMAGAREDLRACVCGGDVVAPGPHRDRVRLHDRGRRRHGQRHRRPGGDRRRRVARRRLDAPARRARDRHRVLGRTVAQIVLFRLDEPPGTPMESPVPRRAPGGTSRQR
ncbi:MAG: MarR family transcriptional regulator [Acidimicrobiia bacterium]|nr:MarR family transcriptional regulator [Acidimicrobiia bacterium]